MPVQLTPWSAGDEITASHLQQPVDALSLLLPATGDDNISLAALPGGLTAKWTGEANQRESWVGLIASAGPDEESDHTDNRYWVKKAYIDSETTEDEAITHDEDPPPRDPNTEQRVEQFPVTVTNLAEYGTHSLPTNETRAVKVYAYLDSSDPPVRHYVMHEPADSVIVKITGNASGGGGGLYTGTIQIPPTTSLDDDGSNLAMPNGMTDGGTVLVANLEESGLPTNWLKSSTYVHGRPVGVADEPNPDQTIIAVDGGYYRTASAATLTANDTKKWHRDEATAGSVYGDTPVEFYAVCTDNAGANPAARKITLDAGGKGWKISEEVADLTTWNPTLSGDNIFIWNGVYVQYPGTTVTGTGTSGDPYTVTPSTTVTVVTDVQYDSTTHKLQKKTRTVTITAAGAESGWTDWHTAVACP